MQVIFLIIQNKSASHYFLKHNVFTSYKLVSWKLTFTYSKLEYKCSLSCVPDKCETCFAFFVTYVLFQNGFIS